MTASAPPSASVVVVNFNGRDDLAACLKSVRDQAFAGRVELIVVDNGSTDGSRELLAEEFADVVLIANDSNVGFSPAVNQGAAVATGDYLALLNNDAVAHPSWLAEAVTFLEGHPRAACAASKILRDDRRTIDYAGGELSFYGHGFAKDNKALDPGGEQAPRQTLFASGGAMVVRRDVYEALGGFDDWYFAFFEDVDFGWRLWLAGHEVHYVPASVVYHRHHGTIERFGYPRERYLLERNALATIYKNYGEESLGKALPGSLVLALLRGLADDATTVPDYRIHGEAVDLDPITVSHQTGAHLAALRDWALHLDVLAEQRRAVQATRVVDDHVLFRLFEQALLPNEPHRDYLEAFANVVRAWGLREHFERPSTIMILTGDQVGRKMAGPAIRSWEMARLLSREHRVLLGAKLVTDPPPAPFEVFTSTPEAVVELLAEADVVVVQGFGLYHHPEIAESDVKLVVDIYDPFHLEALQLRKAEPAWERWATAKSDVEVLNHQLRRGDFFLCASEKQRDFWLGQMAAVERLNPATIADDTLRSLIDVAPFGMPSDPPVQTERAIRGGRWPITDDDLVLLWGGGIYNWFDPLSLIEAVAEIGKDDPGVKLFFLGAAHPNPDVPAMAMATQAHDLAERLGVKDTQVFFNTEWVAYEERQNYLLDADVGVSTHLPHIETAFSFRTRILDYIWAGLPVLATDGDSLSATIEQREIGLTVPPESVPALVAAIRKLREDADLRSRCAERSAALAQEMTWERALAPLLDYCRRPRPAPDRHRVATAVAAPPSRRDTLKRLAGYYRVAGGGQLRTHATKFVAFAREEGLRNALRRVRNFVDLRT